MTYYLIVKTDRTWFVPEGHDTREGAEQAKASRFADAQCDLFEAMVVTEAFAEAERRDKADRRGENSRC